MKNSIFAIQDNQNNFFIKNRSIGGINIPHFGNDASIKIFNCSDSAQKIADTIQVQVSVQQIIKKS